MVRLRGFEVNVIVNGQALEEYATQEIRDEDSERSITRYVEATTGANFEIKWKATNNELTRQRIAGLAVHVEVDGVAIQYPILTEWPYEYTVSGLEYVRSGKFFEQAMSFGELNLTDGGSNTPDALKALLSTAARIGIVEIEVYRAKSFGESRIESNYGSPGIQATTEIDEKAFKGRAVSHQVNFGISKSVVTGEMHDVTYIREDRKAPFLHFKFHYGSRASLQVIGCIPRSPSPVALEDRDLESLSPQEMLELIKRQQATISQSQKTVKREKAEIIGMKRGRNLDDEEEVSFVEARNVRSRIVPGEVIDLLDD